MKFEGYTPIYIKQKFEHKYVKIAWKDGADWNNFKVISVFFDMNFTKTPKPIVYLWLMGVESDDGVRHYGVPFTVCEDEIENIEILTIVEIPTTKYGEVKNNEDEI